VFTFVVNVVNETSYNMNFIYYTIQYLQCAEKPTEKSA